MLFRRRHPLGWLEWARICVWPRRSWMRSGQYVTKRVLRITATPHAVAAGVAAGSFTSFTPFMGLHFLFAAALAWLLRGNIVASALGTFVGNPITFPLIWALTLWTGRTFLGLDTDSAPIHLGEAMSDVMASLWTLDTEQAARGLAAIWEPVFFPMLLGGLPWGLLVSVMIYVLTYKAALTFRDARRTKLMRQAARVRDAAKRRSAEAGRRSAQAASKVLGRDASAA